MVEGTQRKMLLRVASAYRTVSSKAVQVITGVPPIDLLAEERKRLANRHLVHTPNELRQETLGKWQERWENTNDVGQWTKRLIPDIRIWEVCKHRRLDYFLAQFLTGHGSFREYTKRIGKHEGEECIYCGERDTVEHTVFHCERWNGIRRQAWKGIQGPITPDNITREMVGSIESWNSIADGVRNIMRRKEAEERASQTNPLRVDDHE